MLMTNLTDYYDVSLVDGYNIPVFIEPIEGTYNTNGGEYDCKRAGGCVTDVNSVCPPELQVVKNGRVVACKSACLAFNTDQYCCRGAYGTPETCQASQYGKIFKQVRHDIISKIDERIFIVLSYRLFVRL
ncbi:hypothetical protein WR25_25562 [Diploscapter pachys]|uniref:Uncharacterized protein n=1 Tax=Diploscapter pachys TaxID=2018661 RepID=A0A2A2KS74_9BILA|nr:hypothetical protein WR25_25562 [Diploscapter pachys]